MGLFDKLGGVYKTGDGTVVTWKNRIDVRWWFQVADNPTPPSHYLPDDPKRQFKWQMRNFAHNFRRYVVGVSHKNRYCFGSMAKTGNAFKQPSGVLFGATVVPYLPAALPYASWRVRTANAVYDFSVGWSGFGMLMLKARRMTKTAFDWE